jgi:hypothetical protein
MTGKMHDSCWGVFLMGFPDNYIDKSWSWPVKPKPSRAVCQENMVFLSSYSRRLFPNCQPHKKLYSWCFLGSPVAFRPWGKTVARSSTRMNSSLASLPFDPSRERMPRRPRADVFALCATTQTRLPLPFRVQSMS